MHVTLCDVGPRDGLQNDRVALEPPVRAELCDRLAATGLPRIECGSFVNPKVVPQMAGAEEVFAGLQRVDGVVYAALALNGRGVERAVAAGADEVHLAYPLSDTFCARNQNTTLADAAAAHEAMIAAAHAAGRARERHARRLVRVPVRGPGPRGARDRARRAHGALPAPTRSCSPTRSASACRARCARSCRPRCARPAASRSGCTSTTRATPGYANADAGIEAGATIFDASIGGLGGCPFAPRATGNIATEDLVYLLDGLGVETGVDLEALISVAEWLAGVLGARPAGPALQGRPLRPDRLSVPWPSSHSSGSAAWGRLMTPHLVAAGHEVRGFDLDPDARGRRSRSAVRARARPRAAQTPRSRCCRRPRRFALRRSGRAASPRASPPARSASTCRQRRRRSRASSRRRSRRRGVDVLDAPVSGGTIGAEAGTLTIMVGGAEAAAARARPLLEALGTLVVHVGDHGLGQAAKLCNNLCAGVNMAAIAQTLALARREGLDPVVLYELMSNSTGDSRVLRTRFPAPVSDTTPAAHGFAPMFTVDLMEKDLALAEQLAAEHGLEASRSPRRSRSTGARRPRATARSTTRRSRSRPAGARAVSARSSSSSTSCASALGAQRATVRVDVPDAYFPVATSRSPRAPAASATTRTDLRKQPVPRILAESGGQVVQEDSAAAVPRRRGVSRDARALRRACGRRSSPGATATAQLVALLSIHDLRAPRRFSDAERGTLPRSCRRGRREMLDDAA